MINQKKYSAFDRIAWKVIVLQASEVLNGFWLFLILFNPFSPGKIEKLDVWDSNNSANFKHQYLENHKCEVYQLDIIRKLIEHSLRKVLVKTMFTRVRISRPRIAVQFKIFVDQFCLFFIKFAV